MSYTVKQLAQLSGVSVRTLHHYDEIGLLKPAYYGDNSYRYYEEEQLLLLQQILFYKELGFALNDIQEIMSSKDFEKVEALLSHKSTLQSDLDRTKQLIKTIDKTIEHLRGNQPMKLEEIFDGFTDEKQRMYEEFLIESGVSQDDLERSRSNVKNWTKQQWLQHKQESDLVHEKLAEAIDEGLEPGSKQVQTLIAEHYMLTKRFWTPNRTTYIGLSEFYASHPDFVTFYANIHPQLLEFMTAAMTIYAHNELAD